MITLKNVVCNYQTFIKNPGLKGTLQDIFHRQIKTVNALKPLTLTINDGDFVGLIGPNGAGKTTLTKLLTGIIAPTTGKILVDGHTPFRKTNQFLTEIGVMFGQKSQLTWDLPAIDTLDLLAAIYKLDVAAYQKQLTYLVKLLDAQEIIKIPVRKLSLGQRVKCELICSLIHAPKYLFLDEPTLGLDLVMQAKLYRFLQTENAERGTTIIMTSHNVRDIEAMAQRLIILTHGKVIFDDQLKNLSVDLNRHEHFIVKYKKAGNVQEEKLTASELPQFLTKIPADNLVQVKRQGADLEDLILEIYEQQND